MTKLVRVGPAIHASLYRVSNGRFAGRIGSNQLLLLTTTGRKSGKPRTTPLMAFPRGDDLVVVASNGGSDRMPSWYLNLSANPQVHVQIGADERDLTARTATPDEKAQLWPGIVAAAKNFDGYTHKTARELPVVVLSPPTASP